MSVTCYLSGRLGNIFFALANMIAYAKKHNLQYYVPLEAEAYSHKKNPLLIPSTGSAPFEPTVYHEPHYSDGNPAYHEIPEMDDVLLDGYFQSFKYFDWCRDYILDTLEIPYKKEDGIVGISVRRGDCVGSTAFPPAPREYYHNAIEYMQVVGYNKFRLYSDDIHWCSKEFTTENYLGATFEFSEGTEMQDYISLSSCEHQITARSTFSLSAAWINRNPNKIVLVPQKDIWWRGQNRDLIPDYFTQINFRDMYNSNMDEYELEYDNFSFKLFIPDYWVKIYRGQKREPLYHDYCMMLEVLKKTSKNRYVLDIGANHGLFSVPASKLGYKVFGFEPVASNIQSLMLARDANELKKFDMFHLALSNKNDEVEIYVPECPDNSSLSQVAAVSNMRGKEFKTEKVDAVRFDDWIETHDHNYKDIGFIKIDVQGAEYLVFEGMKQYLTNAHDVFMIAEYEHHLNTMGHSFEDLDNLLSSYGFIYVSHITPNDKLLYKA